jgi:uncharacterized membrane protein
MKITMFGLLFIVFLTLKLANIGVVGTWSWWWVTSPIWITWAAVIVVLLLVQLFKLATRKHKPSLSSRLVQYSQAIKKR